MSKVLREGWHDYGQLSIYVSEDGWCSRGLIFDSFGGYRHVRPFAPALVGDLKAVSFRAYSGHHTRYIWA